MSRFNEYMRSRFSGCRLLARARDEHRGRDVQLYAIPGYWDEVGVSDGTDCWIAPVSAGPFFKSGAGDLGALLRALKDGHSLPELPQPTTRRARVTLEDDEPLPRPRRARVSEVSEQTQQAPRKVRHALV